MSTKVRYLFINHGTMYVGRRIKSILAKITPPELEVPKDLPLWKRVQFVFEHLPKDSTAHLIILREPRKLPAKRSRYIAVCNYYGTGVRIRFRPALEERNPNGRAQFRPPRPRRGNNIPTPETRAEVARLRDNILQAGLEFGGGAFNQPPAVPETTRPDNGQRPFGGDTLGAGQGFPRVTDAATEATRTFRTHWFEDV